MNDYRRQYQLYRLHRPSSSTCERRPASLSSIISSRPTTRRRPRQQVSAILARRRPALKPLRGPPTTPRRLPAVRAVPCDQRARRSKVAALVTCWSQRLMCCVSHTMHSRHTWDRLVLGDETEFRHYGTCETHTLYYPRRRQSQG